MKAINVMNLVKVVNKTTEHPTTQAAASQQMKGDGSQKV